MSLLKNEEECLSEEDGRNSHNSLSFLVDVGFQNQHGSSKHKSPHPTPEMSSVGPFWLLPLLEAFYG